MFGYKFVYLDPLAPKGMIYLYAKRMTSTKLVPTKKLMEECIDKAIKLYLEGYFD